MAAAHALDVSDAGAVEAFAAAVFASDGHVDILHNNAGIGHGGNIEATTIEDWQRVIGVNLLGVAYGVQSFIPRMLQQGRPASVVNTASMAGLVPTAKMAPCCACKFGVIGLSESLNAELSKRGIWRTASRRGCCSHSRAASKESSRAHERDGRKRATHASQRPVES